MKLPHVLSFLAALLLFLAPSSAEAGKGKKKQKPVHGVVTAVDNTQMPGKITVRVQPRKKKKAPGAGQATEKVFTYDQTTKFEKLSGKKKQVRAIPATAADVHPRDQVLIVTDKKDVAQSVKIVSKKKGKKTI